MLFAIVQLKYNQISTQKVDRYQIRNGGEVKTFPKDVRSQVYDVDIHQLISAIRAMTPGVCYTRIFSHF